MGRYVEDGRAPETEGGVVVVGRGMLDEQQGGRDGSVGRQSVARAQLQAAHIVGIEQRLQVVVRMVVDVLGLEDGVDVGHGLQLARPRLVVDDTDALARGTLVYEVQSVYASADGDAPADTRRGRQRQFTDGVGLESQDAEGCLPDVEGHELTEVLDDDLALDDVEAALREVGHLLVEGHADGALQLLSAQQCLKDGLVNILGQGAVEQFSGTVEHVAEDAVVQLQLVVRYFGFAQTRHVAVEVHEPTAQPGVDGGRGDDS